MKFNSLKVVDQLNVKDKCVFLRLDLNVPIIKGKITSFKRINETIKTIDYLINEGAKVVILSHFGRPKSVEDIESGKFTLAPVAKELFKKIHGAKNCKFIEKSTGKEVEDAIKKMQPCDVLVLENTRFNDISLKTKKLVNKESENSEELAKYWAGLCDVFVNDAFGAAHRKHASTYGIASFQKNNAIGFLMHNELEMLNKVVSSAKSPFVVIFGGAKISDKLKAVNVVINRADKVIVSGGMAYTFVAAQGFDVGKSMVEESMIPVAKELMEKYKDKLCISSDFMCSPTFSDTKPEYRTQEEGMKGLMGLDIGKRSIKEFVKIINTANTILWNGPMGVTEFSHYENGTNKICEAIAKRTESGAFTVIGGGDSAAAAEKLNKESSFTFISTGGGASLRLIEGSGLDALGSISKKSAWWNIFKRK